MNGETHNPFGERQSLMGETPKTVLTHQNPKSKISLPTADSIEWCRHTPESYNAPAAVLSNTPPLKWPVMFIACSTGKPLAPEG